MANVFFYQCSPSLLYVKTLWVFFPPASLASCCFLACFQLVIPVLFLVAAELLSVQQWWTGGTRASPARLC